MKSKLLLLASIVLFSTCRNNDAEPVAPTADFTAPATGEQAVTVSFQNQSFNATRYVWNFGDRSTGQDENPTHTYAAAGVYAIKLKAFGVAKNDSITKSITVQPYDVIMRSGLRFVASYNCKVFRVVTSPSGSATRTRLPDAVVTITQQGLNTLQWEGFKLFYSPFNPTSPQLPNGSRYAFNSQFDVSTRTNRYASFYITGDSAAFAITELLGHGSIGTSYSGIRRP